jgi:hypothetical protein
MLINLPNGGELPFALILAAVVGFTQPCGRCATTGAAPPAGGIPDRTRRTWLVSGSGPIA